MKEAQQRRCHACSRVFLGSGIQASPEQLKVARNCATAAAVMKRNLVNSVGVKDAKPNIRGGGEGAAHASMVKMYNQADILERCLDKART